ncbi:hypothetical protein DPMN_016091 [Dreissena polymorpha]|uniref:Uncharacterized protein n=1 Tax=Dreissena polymorpha TaxID=45954 RepID=A0A9D4NC94_DREPO|nr:hypothetical protein DPMN_016091 [Dreissena polymorpha]
MSDLLIEIIQKFREEHCFMFTALCRKQSTVTSMASLALYGMLPGIIMGPADKTMFNRAFEQGLANHANAKHDSSKQNKVTSNASVATISRIPTIPSINLEIIDERHDADDDNEDLRSLVTGSNSSLSTSGNTYKALQPSSKSDPGHLIIPNGSPASQRRVSFGNREMQSLLEEQTLEDADEYCDSVDQIEL